MKNKPHKQDKITPHVFRPIIDPKPYPVCAEKSTLPRYGVYKISFPNKDCVVYGSWQWRRDVEWHLERAAERTHKNRWFQKCYNHFGDSAAKVTLLACPLHLDYLHDLETHLAAEHNATLNFKPHTFKIALWLFIENMKKRKEEWHASDVPQECEVI